MSNNVAKKFGLFTSLTMLVGSVVGIGVFFKSHGILRANDWNGIGTLVAWILGGLISIAAAISFSEISSMKTKNVHGLPGWSEKVGGKCYGFFTRFHYSWFYFGIMNVVLAYFGAEMVFSVAQALGGKSVSDYPVYAFVIVGATLSTFMFAMNYFSTKASGIFQNVATVLKWIPLLLVAIAGLALFDTNNSPHGKYGDIAGQFGHSAFTNGTSFKFTKMLAALPAILFAFDAFLNVGALRSKMKNPNQLPLVVFVGMLSILILYIFIALSAILHGSGFVSGAPFGVEPEAGMGVFDQIFSPSAARAMGKFTMIMVAISAFGVMNGMAAGSVSALEQAVDTNSIFGMKTLKRKFGELWTLFIYFGIITLFWTLVIGLPASIVDSDVLIDGGSNFPTLFFFVIYGITIALYTMKRAKYETNKMNKFLFYGASAFAVIGITVGVGYQLVYGFFIHAIIDQKDGTHWGLYAEKDGALTFYEAMPFYFAFLAIFVAMPFVSLGLTKKFEKFDPVMDTQVEELKL